MQLAACIKSLHGLATEPSRCFADLGAEHDQYIVAGLDVMPPGAYVALTNVEQRSALHGMHKRIVLVADAPALVVEYEGERTHTFTTDVCLSPDYHALLRQGRAVLETHTTSVLHDVRNGAVTAWVGLHEDEVTGWTTRQATHGGTRNKRGRGSARGDISFLVGSGVVNDTICQQLIDQGQALLGDWERTPDVVGTHS